MRVAYRAAHAALVETPGCASPIAQPTSRSSCASPIAEPAATGLVECRQRQPNTASRSIRRCARRRAAGLGRRTRAMYRPSTVAIGGVLRAAPPR